MLTDFDTPKAIELRLQLVESMVADGAIRSPEWRQAFECVPRHLFAPVVNKRTETGSVLIDGRKPEQRETWLRTVYGDDSLVTQFDGSGIATSSSTEPSLMALMLEALSVNDGHRVLEIGTGTGYNAALLSHRLGSSLVTSVEIDPKLVVEARRALERCGYHPTLVTADGLEGYPPHAPYDRLIATCSVRRVPDAWLAQVRPGGIVMANVGFGVVPLRVEADGSAHGRFLPNFAAFIEARPADGAATLGAKEVISLASSEGDSRPLSLPDRIDDEEFQFFLRITTPGVDRVVGIMNEEGDEKCYWFADPDTGSWARAEVQRGQGSIIQGGSRRLWDEIEMAHGRWHEAGQPAHNRLGLTVLPGGEHQLWTETPDSKVANF